MTLYRVAILHLTSATPPVVAFRSAGDKANPSLDVLKRLARALGVPVRDLLE